MQARDRGFLTGILLVGLASGASASAGAAQEKEAESNAAIVAKSAGVGALGVAHQVEGVVVQYQSVRVHDVVVAGAAGHGVFDS